MTSPKKHSTSTPSEETLNYRSEDQPVVVDSPYGEMTLEDAVRFFQVSPGDFMVVPIVLPALPDAAGGHPNDEREQHLTDILSITAVMAVEAIYGYIALRDHGSPKVPRDKKSAVRRQAEELVEGTLSAISLSTAEKNSCTLFRDGGWLGLKSGAEAKAYQRSKSPRLEALFGATGPIEDRLEHELHVVRVINDALQRARDYEQALREYREACEAGKPITFDVRDRVEGPHVELTDLLLVAMHARLNPAELWLKYNFCRHEFDAAIFLGDLMAGVPSILRQEQAILLQDIDQTNVEVGPDLTKGDALTLFLKTQIDRVIGRESLDELVTSVVRSGRPQEVLPRFFQVAEPE